jgi:hypothetical protein
MARTRRLAILAATVLALGGCGSSAASPTTSAATTEGPSVVATPAPIQSSVSAASPSPDLTTLATQYTAISASGNAALALCNKDKAAAVASLAKSKAAAQECLNSYIAYVADLKATDWGPAQPQADKVIDDMNKIDSLMLTMINAPDATSFRAAYDQLDPLGASLLVDANAMRAALGLPPVAS